MTLTEILRGAGTVEGNYEGSESGFDGIFIRAERGGGYAEVDGRLTVDELRALLAFVDPGDQTVLQARTKRIQQLRAEGLGLPDARRATLIEEAERHTEQAVASAGAVYGALRAILDLIKEPR